MKAKVDPDLCAGCGVCEEICPVVFFIQEGIAKVKVDPVPPDQEKMCRDATTACPVEAIKLEE